MSKVLARSVREKFAFQQRATPLQQFKEQQVPPPTQKVLKRYPYYLSVCQLMEAGGGGGKFGWGGKCLYVRECTPERRYGSAKVPVHAFLPSLIDVAHYGWLCTTVHLLYNST